jgi:hypothetical protein
VDLSLKMSCVNIRLVMKLNESALKELLSCVRIPAIGEYLV